MKIQIQGQDYTSALDAAHPLTVVRTLNEPATCRFWLTVPSGSTLAAPVRNQSVHVLGDDGSVYFTGYIAITPLPEYAGVGLEGPRYRIAIQALSDDLLLDQLSLAPGKGSTGQTAGALLTSLVTRTGSAALSTSALTLNTALGNYIPQAGAPWSTSASQVAAQARASYRALNGSLSLLSIPSAVHPLNETSGTLALGNLVFNGAVARSLANDVTVCGEHEPVAYVTEYFLGDGTTTQFTLAEPPFLTPSSHAHVIYELFNQTALDTRVWATSGGNGYFALGSGGLAMQGGNGIDGNTLLTWIDPIEMSGTLLLEATGVSLVSGSNGVLAGFFIGLDTQANCTAGFQVVTSQSTGAMTIQPLVQGAACGTAYTVNPANQYALRVRIHCPENQRALAIYRSSADSGSVAYGGQWNLAPAKLLFELQEFVNGVAGMPVTLYDGSLANLPGACQVIAASSINLTGAMRSLHLVSLGSGWVVSTPSGGSPYTRRLGSPAQTGECHFESAGRLVFYPGCAPAVSEVVAVTYRTQGRAVGRAVNTTSQQQLAQQGLPPVAVWMGSVTSPAARSSQDCRNAALALAQTAASAAAVWSGTYSAARVTLDSDVWPGDALALSAPSTSLNAEVIVRSVKITFHSAYPDLIEYALTFANDWAADLAIRTHTTVPADTWFPVPVSPTVLANLNNLAVTSISGNTVTINAGVTPPTGGGFEIRRRDFCFMPGEDPDLVMRSATPTMSFTRTTVSDRYYIRMYDGATPPNYSEFSAALFFNLPLA